MRRALLSAMLGLALGFVGCVATAHVARETVVSVLFVDNQRTVEETIYLEHAGVKGRRLGVVGALSQRTFPLSASDVGATPELTFLAKAFGTGWTDLSDAIVAEPGVRYVWQLAPMRGNTFLSLQHAD